MGKVAARWKRARLHNGRFFGATCVKPRRRLPQAWRRCKWSWSAGEDLECRCWSRWQDQASTLLARSDALTSVLWASCHGASEQQVYFPSVSLFVINTKRYRKWQGCFHCRVQREKACWYSYGTGVYPLSGVYCEYLCSHAKETHLDTLVMVFSRYTQKMVYFKTYLRAYEALNVTFNVKCWFVFGVVL